MRLVASAILALGLVCITSAAIDRLARQNHREKSSNHLTRSVSWVDPDLYEQPQSRLMEDFRTNCIPPSPQYFSARFRRQTNRFNDTTLNETVVSSWNEMAGRPAFSGGGLVQLNRLLTELVQGNSTIEVSPAMPEDHQKYPSEGFEQPLRVDTTREENPEQDYDEKPDEKKNLEIRNDKIDWNKVVPCKNKEKDCNQEGNMCNDGIYSSEISTDESNESLIEQIESDSEPATQHAFWKGQGNPYTIRKAQGRLMKQYMDTQVDPCVDFYQYACGNWANYNPIPKDKAAFDTFEVLRESLDTIIRELLEQNNPNDSEAYIKTKNLYKSCIDDKVLEERGARPLLNLLEKLGGWPVLLDKWDSVEFDWLWLMAQLRLYNNDVLISEWVGPDIKNSDEYVIQFDQPSLGLPTKDYYLHPSNQAYLEAYRTYMMTIVLLLGSDPIKAKHEVDKIIEFETELAKITSGPDERRNVSELYQRMTVGELRAYIPQIDWQRYLAIVLDRPCNVTENVVIFALRYVEDLIPLLAKTEPKAICNYLLWRFVRHRVNNLDDRFQEAKQKFYFALFGREKSPPRWKSCVTQANSNMGMAIGAMFVSKYFDEMSKNDTLVMTKAIQQAFQEILSMINWIDPITKRLASDKINAMLLRIGYPDYILNDEKLNERYKNVCIRSDSYFENTMSILRHLTRVEHNHLGSPVNKTGWNTAPAVVNAYYSRNKNQIMFPAGILQPPFYHRHFPKSLNFGGIGVVIGHEITHGFDDKGRLFDKNGNLHRWWSDESISNFHDRAQCIIEQYSKYKMEEVGHNVDGVNTQGENIADNGGVKQAFRAYKKWVREYGNQSETLPGLNATGYQLFFLNFAQVWCGETRPEALKNKLKTAVHAPGKFRVIGTLSNSEDFSNVFNCPLGAPMNPIQKCTVW